MLQKSQLLFLQKYALQWWVCIMYVLPQVILWLQYGRSWGLHGFCSQAVFQSWKEIPFILPYSFLNWLLSEPSFCVWDERAHRLSVSVMESRTNRLYHWVLHALQAWCPASVQVSFHIIGRKSICFLVGLILLSYSYRSMCSLPTGVVPIYSVRNSVNYSLLWTLASNPG